MIFKMSHQLNLWPFFTHFQYCWGSLSLHCCWQSPPKYEVNSQFFSHLQNYTGQKSAHLSSVRTSICTSDLIPLLLTWTKIKVNHNWAAIPQGVFKTDLVHKKRAEARAETHFHNYNFNLHVWWQIQFRLETSRHGNQEMNSGQKVFVVDDWQANSRGQNTHIKTNDLRTHHLPVWKQREAKRIWIE